MKATHCMAKSGFDSFAFIGDVDTSSSSQPSSIAHGSVVVITSSAMTCVVVRTRSSLIFVVNRQNKMDTVIDAGFSNPQQSHAPGKEKAPGRQPISRCTLCSNVLEWPWSWKKKLVPHAGEPTRTGPTGPHASTCAPSQTRSSSPKVPAACASVRRAHPAQRFCAPAKMRRTIRCTQIAGAHPRVYGNGGHEPKSEPDHSQDHQSARPRGRKLSLLAKPSHRRQARSRL